MGKPKAERVGANESSYSAMRAASRKLSELASSADEIQRSNYGDGGGVGDTPGVGAVFLLERSFCNSSVILCLTIF